MGATTSTRRTALALALLAFAAGSAPARGEEPVYAELPGPGKTCRIGDAYAFIYEFDKTPKMGMVIVKVKLFDRGGARTTELGLVGRADMPSMRGAHDTGEVAFRLNKKGDYLLPINLVMPGEWEVRLVFIKGDVVVFRGALNFDV